MTSLLAASRPEFPLFLHVFGAMVLVGAVGAAVIAQLWTVGIADGDRIRRFSFRTLLFAALPAYIVMRIGAEWMYSQEFGDLKLADPTWIEIGYMTADIGALLLLIALVTAGIAARKAKARLATASGVIAALALAGWIVAVWAMSGKPS